jgi:hypothetical protein
MQGGTLVLASMRFGRKRRYLPPKGGTPTSAQSFNCYRKFDKPAAFRFYTPVQSMPTIQVTCAKRGQGHLSCWRAVRASGIVKEIF